MTVKDFAFAASRGGMPPSGVSDAVKSLWLARAGRWNEAHDMCQAVEGYQGAWVHAHLHRVEGDLDNAGYWYDRAGKTQPEGQSGLGEEWMELAEDFLASSE